MEADFWHERWGSGQTAWNQSAVHPVLKQQWTRHVDAADGSVFVPLCGKSVDMIWLADRGHRVIGSELSQIGVTEFLGDQDLTPEVRAEGPLTVYSAAGFELWCGDFFDLPPTALTDVAAVYDRASLVALPPEMRRRYADHLIEITPPDATVFLLAFEYDEHEMGGPPFSVTRDEVAALYGDAFEIDVVLDDDAMDRNRDLAGRGLSRLSETLTVLHRRT